MSKRCRGCAVSRRRYGEGASRPARRCPAPFCIGANSAASRARDTHDEWHADGETGGSGDGFAGDWWLPAKSVKISDNWEPAPDKIPFGETAHRVLTIEAKGLTTDRLRAPPLLRAPGVISFVGPVDRRTIVTDDGPIARVAYSWDVRPVSITPATAPAIHIPWFDVATRKIRDAVAPEREVAFINAARRAREASATSETFHLLSVWPLAAFTMSFVWTSAVTYLIATRRSHRGGYQSR